MNRECAKSSTPTGSRLVAQGRPRSGRPWVFESELEPRSQAPAWDRISPKLRFARVPERSSRNPSSHFLSESHPTSGAEVLRGSAKQSFEDMRDQAGAWSREKKQRLGHPVEEISRQRLGLVGFQSMLASGGEASPQHRNSVCPLVRGNDNPSRATWTRGFFTSHLAGCLDRFSARRTGEPNRFLGWLH